MSDFEGPIVWLIDEDPRQLRTYQSLLQKAIPKSTNIRVEGVPARPHVGDYINILNDHRTACIIVDHKLNEAKNVDHTGIQLAKELRVLNATLPIYILTNFADEKGEFVNGESKVDDIVSKEEIGDPHELRVFIERLVRRITGHQGLLEAKEQRFLALLKKSLYEDLTKDEETELRELEFQRSAPIIVNEQDRLTKLEKAMSKLEALAVLTKRDIGSEE